MGKRYKINWERVGALVFLLVCWGFIFAGLKACGVWP